jgi:hypothetical protein
MFWEPYPDNMKVAIRHTLLVRKGLSHDLRLFWCTD